jgi:uncharacterized repeat protein (TIGR02543 family)
MKSKKVVVVLAAVVILVSVTIFASCDNPWWPQKDNYTVTFHANGGTGKVPEAQSVVARSSITLPHGNGLTKTGYTFNGWNKKRTGDGDHHHAGSSFTPAGHITLYARWVNNETGKPDSGAPDSGAPDNGDSTASDPGGVNNTGTGSGNRGGNTGNTSSTDKAGGLDAGGLPVRYPTLSVTYHPNNGGSGGSVTYGAYALGATVPVKTNSDAGITNSDDDKVFMGWATHAAYIEAKGDYHAPESTFIIEEDTDLYAYWVGKKNFMSMGDDKYYTFPDQVYGYNQAKITPWNIVIHNSGTAASGSLNVTITKGPDNPDNVFGFTLTGALTISSTSLSGIDPDGKLPFSIVPDLGLSIGTYSILIQIHDAADFENSTQRASYMVSFTVLPYPLYMEVVSIEYRDTPYEYATGCITPLAATLANGDEYTEATAIVTVKVWGFQNAEDAEAGKVGFTISDPDGDFIFDFPLESTKHEKKGAYIIGSQYGTQLYDITVTYDSQNTEPLFPTGSNIIRRGIIVDLYKVPDNYFKYAYAGTFINIIDGLDPARPVPINKTNNETLYEDEYGYFRTPFNYYANTYGGSFRHYRQMENIVLDKPEDEESNWTAIGEGGVFTGSYDGGGRTITGLVIYEIGFNKGMFGDIGDATVKDLGLVNVSITTQGSYAGGLIGYDRGNSTLTGVYVTTTGNGTSSVTGGSYTGGVVGWSNTNSTLDGLYFTSTGGGIASVIGNGESVGGVVGYNSGTVKNSRSTGSITASGGNVGGIVGKNENGEVLNSYSTANVTGYTSAGGIVGENNDGTVEYCYYTTGTVAATHGNSGGIVGNNEGGEVRYCYVMSATITITASQNNNSGNNAAGVVARNYNGKVEQCFALGTNVTGLTFGTAANNNVGRYIAGVVGWNNGTVLNCYVSGGTVDGSTYTGGVVGRNTGLEAITEYCYSTCEVIGRGAFSNAADFLGGVVGANHNDGITRNNVALNPSVTGLGLRFVGRVVGKNSTHDNKEIGTTPINNYAQSDMTTTNNGTSKASDVIDGDLISADAWNSASWWINAANWTYYDDDNDEVVNGVWDPDIWNITNNSLPTLKNMPGNPVQDPQVP